MKFKRMLSAVIVLIMTASVGIEFYSINAATIPERSVLPYMDTSLSFEERAADLVSRMTLEEKISQLGHGAPAISRLGITKYNYWREGIHGVARQGKATSFPTSLAMSNTWDRELLYKMADITSTEARGKNSKYNLSYWSPTINMARDPRWGRNDETYGEDPYLTTEYGIEFVNGMQGNDPKYLKTIATLKHFAANNCESERQGGSSVMDEQTLHDYYCRAFKDIVEKSAPASVMSSYNAITLTRNGENVYDYIPSSANSHLLNDLLRRNWGFEGYVTGDCGSVNNLNSRLTYKRTLFPDAADLSAVPQSATIAKAIQAGNDLDCGAVSQENGYEAVEMGYMSEDEVDLAVYRMFLQRMRTGEFDTGVTYHNITSNVLEKAEHIAVAEEAAEKSLVLLKNEDGILPIKNDVKKIALVGNLASEAYLGDYSGTPEVTTSPYEGLVEVLGKTNPNAEINYLGNVTDETVILNLKSLKLVLSDGSKRTVDLAKATEVSGMTLSNGEMNNVARNGAAVIKNINFADVVSAEAEMSNGINSPGGEIILGYGSANQQVAAISTNQSLAEGKYGICTGEYTGASGGYNKIADLYIKVNVNSEFSVDKYTNQLNDADIIIAYAGTTTSDSSESKDRAGIALPASQAHVDAITSKYPEKTIVVMQTVGQIDISSFENNAKAILWTCYNGQAQGTALAKVLTGQVNPSGKLTTTWYDPADLQIMKVNTNGIYDNEGIKWSRNDYSIRQKDGYPGRTYQYYSGDAVYPFGYGLSYTDFVYGNLSISDNNIDVNGKITVTADVENTGDKFGSEVVQLYIKSPNGDGINLPLKQLKGFDRVELQPGEKKTVTMEIEIADLHFYDEGSQKIFVPNGRYIVMVGKNAEDKNMLTGEFNVSGDLKKDLKTVQVIPTGVTVIGTIKSDGAPSNAISTINAQTSAVMSDETEYPLEDASVTYTSSNDNVATVSNDGTVSPGISEGTSLITVSVTVDGVTKEDVFPVVCRLKNAVDEEVRTQYINQIKKQYEGYNKENYSEKNWSQITTIYQTAYNSLLSEVDGDMLKVTAENAIAEMSKIKVKPPVGVDIYELSNITDGIYNNITLDIKYNGDETVPEAVLIGAVEQADGELVRISETVIGDSGTYEVKDKFKDGEIIKLFVWNSVEGMKPLSEKHKHVFEEQIGPEFMIYNFSESDYDSYATSTDGIELKSVNGLGGFGGFANDTSKKTYTYNGVTYNFTRGLKSGAGSQSKRCINFKPFAGYSQCKVTVLFNAATDRYQGIYQDGKELVKAYGSGSGLAEVSCVVTDMTKPIYTYGGSNNKTIYAIIVEYEK